MDEQNPVSDEAAVAPVEQPAAEQVEGGEAPVEESAAPEVGESAPVDPAV